MASQTTRTTIFGYASAFWCLDALAETSKLQTPRRDGFFPSLAAGALLLATFVLTSLLLFAHVRAHGAANDAGGAAAARRRRRLLDRLANAVLTAAAAALLAGAALRLGVNGNLGGADDIGWLWIDTA